VSTLEAPDADRYQLFNDHDAENFRQTGSYLGMTYSERPLIVEITSLEARDDQLKKSLLVEINHNLVAAGVLAADDVFVMITQIGRARVSFGGGAAPGARLEPVG
jgi:4-oxalocrotonate tautomerase